MGVVDNYSKWTLRITSTETKYGLLSHSLKDVNNGTREGFASHKYKAATVGSMLRFSFNLDDDVIVQVDIFSELVAQWINSKPKLKIKIILCEPHIF